MKFFPYESDRPIEDEMAEYLSYVETLGGAVPARLLELMDVSLGLDDALLIRVEHDHQVGEMELVLLGGHSQIGYYDLVLHYHQAEISAEQDLLLARIARTTVDHRRYEYDLCWHEFDVADGGEIVHRLSFHSKGHRRGVWLAVTCRSMDWARIPRLNGRVFGPVVDRYPGGPAA